MPATTCALVMTRSGAYTKPDPSTRRAQDSASPVILTTDGRGSVTAGLCNSFGSGCGTLRTRVGTSGPNTSGKSYAADGVPQRGVERADLPGHHVVDRRGSPGCPGPPRTPAGTAPTPAASPPSRTPAAPRPRRRPRRGPSRPPGPAARSAATAAGCRARPPAPDRAARARAPPRPRPRSARTSPADSRPAIGSASWAPITAPPKKPKNDRVAVTKPCRKPPIANMIVATIRTTSSRFTGGHHEPPDLALRLVDRADEPVVARPTDREPYRVALAGRGQRHARAGQLRGLPVVRGALADVLEGQPHRPGLGVDHRRVEAEVVARVDLDGLGAVRARGERDGVRLAGLAPARALPAGRRLRGRAPARTRRSSRPRPLPRSQTVQRLPGRRHRAMGQSGPDRSRCVIEPAAAPSPYLPASPGGRTPRATYELGRAGGINSKCRGAVGGEASQRRRARHRLPAVRLVPGSWTGQFGAAGRRSVRGGIRPGQDANCGGRSRTSSLPRPGPAAKLKGVRAHLVGRW